MKIVKINPQNPEPEAIKEAINVLENRGVIVYPTDTCYGLGADMTNIFAVDKLFKIKGRDFSKPVSVIVKNIAQIKQIALVEDKQTEFLKKYLPGKITAVLLNTDFTNFKSNSIGIRIPKYKITQLISEGLDKPYSSTSANISDLGPCYDIPELIYQFKNREYKPDLILDAGILPKSDPSTVVDLIKWPPKIIRQGAEKIEI
ncbi:MAG: L-threonylcarbamoyladenylate synthase [Patescibacteria group bacterium]|nr:L-threonylcarbamoyladenylate synthase [Patescibacteria group bacterium]